jgi:hypothetical protein
MARKTKPPHGPVSERFMRHHYGASGLTPRLTVGARVYFANDKERAAPLVVKHVALDGMVEVSGYSGLFGPHLFVSEEPMTPAQVEKALLQTQAERASVKRTLGTLIAWLAQTASQPLSVNEAKQLLEMLPPER